MKIIFGTIIDRIFSTSQISIKHTNEEIVLSLDDRLIILERGSLLPKSMTYYENKDEEYVIIHYLFEINSVQDIKV